MPVSDIGSVNPLVDEPESDVPQTLPVGVIIGGKYEIKRVLGMGGNGAVANIIVGQFPSSGGP